MLDQLKQWYELKKQADHLQKVLRGLTVEAEGGQGAVRIVMNGEMKIRSLTLNPEWLTRDRKVQLEEAIKECVASALAKVHRAAASQIGGMSQIMNLLKG